MNKFSFLSLWSAVVIAVAVGCESPRESVKASLNHQLKYKIDGKFDDWKTFRTGQTSKDYPWGDAVITPPYEGFIIKEFYYDNDDKYLYLFFKCKPTIDEIFNKRHSLDNLEDIYIKSDIGKNTGCAERDSLGNSTLPGADIQIQLPAGWAYDSASAQSKFGELYIQYHLARWNSVTKNFDRDVRIEDSRGSFSLIAHGKDGVEMAIPLKALQLVKGSKFAFAYWEELLPALNVNWTTIQIE
jgi:hypothetical protein